MRLALTQLRSRLLPSLTLLALGLSLLAPATASAALPTPAPAPGKQVESSGAPAPAPAAPAPAAPAQAAPSSGVAKSSISGTILLDEDLDGSPSRGDRPLVGLTVSIVGPGISTGATTNGNGSFTVGGLPAGAYTVSLALPGGVVAPTGTSRTVQANGSSAYRTDFFVARADRAPAAAPVVPTATPVPPMPTATPVPPMPTSTPKPLPTPVPAPGHAGPAGPAAAAQRGTSPSATRPGNSYQGNLLPPIATSYGPRYAPGRGNPSAIEPIRTDSSLWLGVPFITQLDGTTYSDVNCGPASTAMVLAAFGIRTSPAAIRNYVNDISGVYSQGVGTSLDHLGRVLRESGLEVTSLYEGGRYLRWSTELVREELKAGRPVVTLVKYRALPGHTGSYSDFDHYIVISGLSGDDFIYNDAAYSSDRGYGLLISPRDLERAWDYSSIPRHGMAVGLKGGAQPEPQEATAEAASPSDEELLAESDVSLGEEVGFVDSFSALTFGRVDVEAEAEPAATVAPEEPTLELANFLDVQPIEPADPIVPAQPITAMSAGAPAPSLPPANGFAVPLVGLSLCLGIAIFAIGGRRILG